MTPHALHMAQQARKDFLLSQMQSLWLEWQWLEGGRLTYLRRQDLRSLGRALLAEADSEDAEQRSEAA